MDINDLNQVTQYFVQYMEDEQLGHKFFHKENDNFKIIITPDKELYQLNTDHEICGIEPWGEKAKDKIMILPPVEQYLISREKRLFKGFSR